MGRPVSLEPRCRHLYVQRGLVIIELLVIEQADNALNRLLLHELGPLRDIRILNQAFPFGLLGKGRTKAAKDQVVAQRCRAKIVWRVKLWQLVMSVMGHAHVGA